MASVRKIDPSPLTVFEEPTKAEKRHRGVFRAIQDILGYKEDEESLKLTNKILEIADGKGEVDTGIVEYMKGMYSHEVIAATLDRLRRCPAFRELAYGEPAPEGFAGAVNWDKLGANAYPDEYY